MPAIQLMTVSNTETTPAAQVSGAKPQKLQGLQSTFSSYMRQNSSGTAQMAKEQSVIPQAKQAGSDTNVKQQYEQYQSKAAVQADKAAGGAEVSDGDAQAVQEAVDEAAESIQEVIKENLDVDDEQIEAAMELLGLTSADLLDTQQLIALVVELTGSEDAGSMLFQENFQLVMQETGVITDDLLQELGMSMDELVDQIHTMLENTEQPIETMLPQQEAQPEQAAQKVQEVQVQEIEVQEVQQETAPEQTLYQPQREAVQTQPEQPKEAVQEVQQETAPAEEEQPQETKQVQKVQPQEENTQTGQQPTTQEDSSETLFGDRETQENPRFDFHTNVHTQESAVHVQAPQNPTAAPLPQINMQDVIDQIVQHTRLNLSGDVKSIEMQLNPENLGKVYVHVSEKQGTITAQLTAQNENVKEALIQQAAILKDNLNQQGIKVDAVEVTAGTHEFESSLERDAHSQEEQARQQEEQSMRRSRRSINLNDLNDLEGLSGLMSDEEALVAQIMRDNGNNVDYKA